MRTPPTMQIGAAQADAAARRVSAGDPRRRGNAGRLVSERCGKAKNVADLFCGVGPFALRLATQARVTASDSEPARSPR